MSNQVTPNKLQQAIQELSDFDLINFEIPTKIQAGEQSDYVVICVKSKDNSAGTKKIHEARLCYAPVHKWRAMEVEKASGRVKGMFLGMFQKEVILHNPTLPNVKPKAAKPKVKGLSPTHKSKANEMQEQGASAVDIADALGVDLERVEAHLNK